MGSVVQMRLLRAAVLAIVMAAALAASGGLTASARASTGPALVAEAAPFGAATTDPSDPGLPPD
jgi:hypothetical protein